MSSKSIERVAVIVLNWNGFSDTKKCLESLLSQDYSDFSVIVIDNASEDNSPVLLKDLQKKLSDKRLHIIYNRNNFGFAGGVNTGIRYALNNKFDAVALFNNDAVADTKWLKSLVEDFNATHASVITGLLMHENKKTIDSTGELYSSWGMPFPRNRNRAKIEASEPGYIFGATGGATLYSTSLFEQIGLFDELFFAYYEDVDLSFRAQLAGHKVYYTNRALAYHKQGASSKKIPGFTVYQTFKNIPLLFIKNVPNKLILPIGMRLSLTYLLMFGNALKNGSGKYAIKGWLASVWYFWTKSLWERFRIQSQRKVSTKYIDSMLYHDIPPDQTGMRKFRKFFTGKA